MQIRRVGTKWGGIAGRDWNQVQNAGVPDPFHGFLHYHKTRGTGNGTAWYSRDDVTSGKLAGHETKDAGIMQDSIYFVEKCAGLRLICGTTVKVAGCRTNDTGLVEVVRVGEWSSKINTAIRLVYIRYYTKKCIIKIRRILYTLAVLSFSNKISYML